MISHNKGNSYKNDIYSSSSIFFHISSTLSIKSVKIIFAYLEGVWRLRSSEKERDQDLMDNTAKSK